MILSEICPICGSNTFIKEVTEVIRGGKHTATLKVEAEVCLRCGERLYTPETVRYFEDIKAKLERDIFLISETNPETLSVSPLPASPRLS